MSQKPTRNLIKIVFENFIKSLRPRQFRGNYVGEDYFGNKYYEIPANPSIGKRKPSRWFEPSKKNDFDQELTAEWEAWLRGRRDLPPTEEELLRNLQIMQSKKVNAAKLDAKYGTGKHEKDKYIGAFPKYDEYEINPNTDKHK